MANVFNVVGYKFYNFKPKDSDKSYSGVTLYLVSEDCTKPDQNMYGSFIEKVNVPDSVPYDPHLGDQINIFYNKFGKVEGVGYV